MNITNKIVIACSVLLIITGLVVTGCSSAEQQESDTTGAESGAAQNEETIGTMTNYSIDFAQVPEEGKRLLISSSGTPPVKSCF